MLTECRLYVRMSVWVALMEPNHQMKGGKVSPLKTPAYSPVSGKLIAWDTGVSLWNDRFQWFADIAWNDHSQSFALAPIYSNSQVGSCSDYSTLLMCNRWVLYMRGWWPASLPSSQRCTFLYSNYAFAYQWKIQEAPPHHCHLQQWVPNRGIQQWVPETRAKLYSRGYVI